MGDTTTTDSWGAYLRQRMDDNGWSQAELARASGLSETVISRWRRGQASPGLDNARAVAVTLRRPLLEVLVAAGLITPQEAKQRARAPIDPTALSNEQLLAELGRRLPDQTAPSEADVDAEPDEWQVTGRRKKTARAND